MLKHLLFFSSNIVFVAQRGCKNSQINRAINPSSIHDYEKLHYKFVLLRTNKQSDTAAEQRLSWQQQVTYLKYNNGAADADHY